MNKLSHRKTTVSWGARRRKSSAIAKILAFASLLSVGSVALAEEPIERVDLNRASAEQLCTLPGVGPKRAEAIIHFRQRRRFTRVSQLLLVRGIGRKTLRRLRPLLMVSPRKPKPVTPVLKKPAVVEVTMSPGDQSSKKPDAPPSKKEVGPKLSLVK